MKTETAQKAAKWWADHLRYGCKFDNGDESETGFMTMMLATLTQKSHDEKSIEAFEKALVKQLEKITRDWECINVDYHPGKYLSEAINESGIEIGMSDLPCKTQMWIEGEKITYSLGYRGEIQKL